MIRERGVIDESASILGDDGEDVAGQDDEDESEEVMETDHENDGDAFVEH